MDAPVLLADRLAHRADPAHPAVDRDGRFQSAGSAPGAVGAARDCVALTIGYWLSAISYQLEALDDTDRARGPAISYHQGCGPLRGRDPHPPSRAASKRCRERRADPVPG